VSFNAWLLLVGALVLCLALCSAWIRRSPISVTSLYLGIGVALGPWGVDLLSLDVPRASTWLEHTTEILLVVSLFIGGLRLRLPPSHPTWGPVYRLAAPLMILTIIGVAAFCHFVLGLNPALALLVGAILAPTDPVLAGEVTVGHAGDRDRLRYALSGEAGLNDGAAFPFVVLSLLLLHTGATTENLTTWALHRVAWAVPAALICGFVLGRLVGRVAIALRSRNQETAAPTDFLALALILLAYASAEAIGAWGFLAAFAAGVGLRAAEKGTVEESPHPDARAEEEPHPPAETLVEPNTVTSQEMQQPAVAAGVLVAEVFTFGDTIERLVEALLVVLIGISLASHWDVRGFVLGLVLIAIIRPPLTMLCLAGSALSGVQRALIGWFGIRGIGSLYYLAYACTHGLSMDAGGEVAGLVITAVTTSIVVHGVSCQPLMEWYERRNPSREAR
jgi:NhaP-type Na+/H+ or K+/H+ antiporter